MKIGSRECAVEDRKTGGRQAKPGCPNEWSVVGKRTEKGARSSLLMGNDKEWAAGIAGRAWVGHIADTGVGVVLGVGRSLARLPEEM
jgi:hypothetical protein